MTWNIRAAIGPGEPFPPAWWRHVRLDRLERIASIIRALDPDVVTLQEVAIMTPDGALLDEPEVLARLTGRSPRYAAVHAFPLVEPDTGRAIGMASWGNAILSRKPLVDGFAVGLPRAADDDPVEVGGALHYLTGEPHPLIDVRYADSEPGHREPRCVVGGRLAGQRATIATTHLTYIGRAQRRVQADSLAVIVRDRAGPVGPAILTGDFNAPLEAPELAALGDGFLDAFELAGIAPHDPRRQSCGPSSIDHIRVRGLAVDSCRVATEAGDASDHWPVVADLRLGSA
ncbi:MAG TPA: endonuclease/exonuclease/phosphatase family protein [Patescibacteria group bacterium]|nr:endonuclease/exonuclease/phosphatase family protein [Patescibacteria group bacterium]